METNTAYRRSGRIVLTQNFHADRALPRDHVGVVERMRKGKLRSFFSKCTHLVRIGIGSTVQHDLAYSPPKRLIALTLITGVHPARPDHRLALSLAAEYCHALRMIARRSSDHALFSCAGVSCAILLYAPRILYENAHICLAFQDHLIVNAA